jgi:hypothetical protein
MEYPEKTTDLPKAADKLYHIMLYRVHLTTTGNQTDNISGNKHWLHVVMQLSINFNAC